MLSYELTPSVIEDLQGIARYTVDRWGKQQSMKYAAGLDSCFKKIANDDVVPRNFLKNYPDLFVTRYEHHYVFYLKHGDEKPIIIAVFHEKMHVLERLKDRLS